MDDTRIVKVTIIIRVELSRFIPRKGESVLKQKKFYTLRTDNNRQLFATVTLLLHHQQLYPRHCSNSKRQKTHSARHLLPNINYTTKRWRYSSNGDILDNLL